jgi:hypothetical protein
VQAAASLTARRCLRVRHFHTTLCTRGSRVMNDASSMQMSLRQFSDALIL